METKISLNKIYKPSDGVVARDVHGEFIIIPITSGIGDLEDEAFFLNETGRAMWDRLDGKRTLKKAVEDLDKEFIASSGKIEKDVLGVMQELLQRRMLVEVQ